MPADVGRLAFFGEWRPLPERRAGGVRAGPSSTATAHPHRRPARLRQDAAGRRADPAASASAALVLAPNRASSSSGRAPSASSRRSPRGVAGADPLKPIACLSYQALCQLEDPEIVARPARAAPLGGRAGRATGCTPEAPLREGEDLRGRRGRPPARASSRGSRRAQARGRARRARGRRAARPARRDAPASASQQLAKLRRRRRRCSTSATTSPRCGATSSGPCSTSSGTTHVIGLTATPPVELPEAEAELYDALLGPVDFTVPTPAVVQDGHLAPYQELAWLTEPLGVRARLAGRARHPLPRAGHRPARRRSERCPAVPGAG